MALDRDDVMNGAEGAARALGKASEQVETAVRALKPIAQERPVRVVIDDALEPILEEIEKALEALEPLMAASMTPEEHNESISKDRR